MHYYKFNIGDYRRRTQYLTPLEHGIYRLLLDTYYLEEGPLCTCIATVMRTHNIRTAEEQQALENVLNDFFELRENGYFHNHCDEEIEKYQANSEKKSAAAKARWDKHAPALQKQSKRNANHKPITNNHKPITKDQKRGFRPPSLQEVRNYVNEKNYSIDSDQFINFYESKGWMVGKNKMKSWQACVRTWEKRENDKQNTGRTDTRSRAKKVSDELDNIAKAAIERGEAF